ncbi:MAG: ATP-binding protein [Thermomicrobiales bacterium]
MPRSVYLGGGGEHPRGRRRAAALDVARAVAGGGAQAARLTLLGPPRLARDGQPVALTSAKALGLLAYLAVHEHPQAREHLLALLWPESDEVAAHKNLRNALWQLRRGLGGAAIAGTTRLALAETVWADVRAFANADQTAASARAAGGTPLDAYRTMAKLYAGDLLEGLAFADAPDFELWLTGERERYRERYLSALARLASAHRAAGRWRALATVARAALARDPLREPMHRALMEAQARLGDRVAALRQYDALRATLDRELGVAPLPETDRLRDAIRAGTLPPVPHSPAPARPAPATSRTPPPVEPFVGRAAELAALDTAWALAQRGARVALLTGEAGIGKTRLWTVWAARLAAPARALAARCLPATRQLPFAPLAELLRGPAGRAHLTTLAGSAPPAWFSDIAGLVPELGNLLPEPPPPLPPDEGRRRMFEALAQALAIAPDRPLALFIDDLHWADQSTLDWLGYLTHRTRALPLLLVAAYRPEEAPPELTALAVTWSREGRLHRLAPPRLDAAEAAALVAALGGDVTRAGALYAHSAGNPYFLAELLHAVPGAVPASLGELIAGRLARLPDGARQLLQAAAILGDEADFPLLQQTAGRTDDETLDALDTLMASRLLVEQNGRYVFDHPLVADVVEAELSGARRAVLHRRAATVLERLATGRLPEVAGRLARHWEEAGVPASAARYAELAGDRALALAAPVEAARFYQQALNLEATPARYLGLGRARSLQADQQGARTAFTAATRGYAAAGDRRGAARAEQELSRALLASGQRDEAVTHSQHARALLGDATDPATRALIGYLLGMELRAVGASPAAATAALEEARTLAAGGHAPELLPGILFELGNLRAEAGDLAGALARYQELIGIAHATGDTLIEVIGQNNFAYHATLAGDLPAARAAATTGLALAEAHDVQVAFQWLYGTHGELALAEAHWAEAERWFRRGRTEAERQGNTTLAATYTAGLGRVARGRGDRGTAAALLEAARGDAEPRVQAQIDHWLAELRRASDSD